MSATVPAGILQSGPYRWFVEVQNNGNNTRTRSQYLTFIAGASTGPVLGDELAVDFGNLGIWHYNAGAWSQISAGGTEFMVLYNNNLLVGDFGAAGVYQLDGANWTQLSPSNPDNNGNAMVPYGTGLVVDFGADGLWYYNGTSWSQISAAGTEFMVVYNNNLLVGDFGAAGVYQFDGANWTQLSPSNPDNNGNAFVDVNLVN